jgi:hypothetical protein
MRALGRSEPPGWEDLIAADNSRLEDGPAEPAFLGTISTLRFVLGVLAVAGVFTLYVGHVYATQDLLADVQRARKENLTLQLQLNRTRGLYHAATGPGIIYERAEELGLEERMISGPPIVIPRE